MAHPNVERFQSALNVADGEMPDPDKLRDLLAEDVVWREAGNPEPIRGRDAVLERFSSPPGTMKIESRAVLADDDTVIWEGYATFDAGEQHLEYPFVERYTLRDGKVAERQAYMDAVPEDVAQFFSAMGG